MRAHRWYAAGDVNATFGLVVDNLTNLVVLAGLLIGVFHFPADLVLYRMVPGTALGVLVGDLVYTWLACRLARDSGRADVTAMPFGIDTPSLFGITFAVIGPAMMLTNDPVLAWKLGMGTTVAMGIAKLALSFGGEWVRRVVPRAGLLGSIAGVAILLIAFLPALKVFADPLVGLVALGLILVTFVGGITLPGRIPGALAAVVAERGDQAMRADAVSAALLAEAAARAAATLVEVNLGTTSSDERVARARDLAGSATAAAQRARHTLV